MKSRVMAVCGLMSALWGWGQEIGYVETFSLAGDRGEALKELVPGTDDYYYYHALHAQNSGARPQFQEVMDRWVRDRNGTVAVRHRSREEDPPDDHVSGEHRPQLRRDPARVQGDQAVSAPDASAQQVG